LKPHEVLRRLSNGEVPVQPFFHCQKRHGYRWIRVYHFDDGEIVTAQVVSDLLKKRMIHLVVDGNYRRIELRRG